MTPPICDSREPAKLKDLVKAAIPNVEIRALHSADFAFEDCVGHRIGVERKAVSDFLASISTTMGNGNQRLGDQLDRVATDYDCGILLLEGFWTLNDRNQIKTAWKQTGWSCASMQMALLSLQKKHQIKVLWTPDQRATVVTIKALIERAKIKEF